MIAVSSHVIQATQPTLVYFVCFRTLCCLLLLRAALFINIFIEMCLKENYSDSPSNEYSRHYSAESESQYLRRQNMDSKLGEEQKKGRSPGFDSNSDKKQKKGQNDNGLILGRVSVNTRTRPNPSNALLLGRVLGLDSAHPYIYSVFVDVK